MSDWLNETQLSGGGRVMAGADIQVFIFFFCFLDRSRPNVVVIPQRSQQTQPQRTWSTCRPSAIRPLGEEEGLPLTCQGLPQQTKATQGLARKGPV